jgi:hypothetical protein
MKINEKHLAGKLSEYLKTFSERMTIFCKNMGCDPNDEQSVRRFKEMIVERMKAQVIGFHFDKDIANNKRIFFSAADRVIKINDNIPDSYDEFSIMHELFYALTATIENHKGRIRFGIYTIIEHGEMTPEAIRARSANQGLNRGFTKMITDMMMNVPETNEGLFSGLTQIARRIRDMFGIDLIFAAMFEGPEILEDAFDSAGNKDIFKELSETADKMLEIDEQR